MPTLLCAAIVALAGIVTSPAQGQHLVTGRVTDAVTGETLPAANIVVEGTYRGTITNQDGAYELRVAGLPATLVARYIGYTSRRIPVRDVPEQRIDFKLEPVTYGMPEIVVTDENPAIPIMQCVIDRKQVWRAALESYQADAYTRFTISNDTGIVSIVESLSEVFWDRGRGSREIVTSQRRTSNMNIATVLPAAQFVANLYDDNIDLAGYTFVGVTHPRAFDAYRFGLQGTRMMDDRLVYDISVEPRNRLKTAFSGELAVLADECALLSVALEPGEAFLFPPPIKRLDLTFYQQYNNFGGEAWLPADFRSDIVVEVSMGFLMSFPPFRIRQVSRLTNYEMDAAIPDSLFARGAETVVVDSAAVRADTLLSREGLAVPLDSLERLAYRTVDSTMTMDRAFAPSGALARIAEIDDDEREEESTSRFGFLDPLNLSPDLRFNRVESFHGGLTTDHSLGRLRLHAGAAWNSGLETDPWSYDAYAELRLGRRDHAFLRAEYLDGVVPRTRSGVYFTPMTSLYSLLGGGDYHDYLSTNRIDVGAGYARSDWSLAVTARFEKPRSVAPSTAYDLLGRVGSLQPNPPIQSGDVRSVSVTLGIGDRGNTLGFTGRQYLEIEAEHGTSDTGGVFGRVGVEVQGRIETLFRRRLIPNVFDVRIVGGVARGDLPAHRFGIVDGSLGAYRPFGALRTRTGRPYEGDHYAGILWEHSFRTVPFELLGLHGLARRGYGILLTGGHARTWVHRSDLIDDPKRFASSQGGHHEIGLALSGLFSVFRVDVAARLDAPGVTLGLSAARLF